MEYSYGDLAFMSLIIEGNKGDIFTVYLRLRDKVGVIEHTDSNGELLEARKEKLIRTSAFGPFMEKLEALDVLNWPRHQDEEQEPDRRSNVLLYSFKTADSDYIDYNTKGNSLADLEKVHQLIEEVLGETFANY